VLKIHVTDSKGVLESLACFEKFVEKYGQPEVDETITEPNSPTNTFPIEVYDFSPDWTTK
ncbi:MAG: hypothetical protein NZM12_09800, partial [Steroidobacteraceae bacterium]|nr:hypothetical protein [Steroidobacteraceae bacterium]